jgi:hypothetical protein
MEKTYTHTIIPSALYVAIFFSILMLSSSIKAFGNDNHIPSSSRFNLDSDLRDKSNTGWKLNKSIREKKKSRTNRWVLDEEIRRKDATEGFNYNPTNVEKD